MGGNKIMELLKKLTQCFGPSGNEEDIREIIINELKDYSDEILLDPLGNLIVRKKGTGKKIMLAAHMDEISLIVTYIDENGFLRFSNIGGVSAFNSLYQKVSFRNGTIGIISYEEKIEDMKELSLDKMYIDIGAKDKEEAEKLVNIGDVASFIGSFNISKNRVSSKAIDDRIGCYVLIKALKTMQNTSNDLYFVFTVQEELGLRGAKTSSFSISPDYAIAVDVTRTGDTPECKPMAVKLGGGPAIKVKDSSIITHPFIRGLMVDTAKEQNIPYQMEILERGGTDSGAIHLTKGGIPSGVLSIPARYVHSPCELVDITDVENAIKLLKAILEKEIK